MEVAKAPDQPLADFIRSAALAKARRIVRLRERYGGAVSPYPAPQPTEKAP